MLHALPFTTFGEAAALSLEAHVYCPCCFTTRRIAPAADRARDRCFASARFRCTNVRWSGETCGGSGSVTVRSAELLSVGRDFTLAFLWCDRCLPSWRIHHVPMTGRYGTSSVGRRRPLPLSRVSWRSKLAHSWSDMATLPE